MEKLEALDGPQGLRPEQQQTSGLRRTSKRTSASRKQRACSGPSADMLRTKSGQGDRAEQQQTRSDLDADHHWTSGGPAADQQRTNSGRQGECKAGRHTRILDKRGWAAMERGGGSNAGAH